MSGKGQSKSAAALRNILESHTATDVVQSQAVVELKSDMSLIDAANSLWKHNILGAPVWNEEEKRYVGFFDMRDILSAVTATMREYQKEQQSEAKGDGSQSSMLSRYNSIMVTKLENIEVDKTNKKDSEEPAKVGAKVPGHITITYLAARNPFQSCSPTETLNQLCRVLYQLRCHRVPIVDSTSSTGNKCTAIISQSALLRFLSAHISPNDKSLDETLDEAGIEYRKPVVMVNDTTEAFEAFDMLDSKRLSGIAVVDEEDGKLVGNTSARDIKLATMNQGKIMMDTDILSYLAQVRQAEHIKNDRYPSCHVYDDTTVRHVVNLLAKTGYHRVFVTDKDVKPVGVISVTDILRFALNDGNGNSTADK